MLDCSLLRLFDKFSATPLTQLDVFGLKNNNAAASIGFEGIKPNYSLDVIHFLVVRDVLANTTEFVDLGLY